MSKNNRRKFSEFAQLAHNLQPDTEDSLFDFDAPRFASLEQNTQNPSYSPNILDFSLKPKSDDYWFTYSHYLHEEDPNEQGSSRMTARASSIYGKNALCKPEDKDISNENARLRSASREPNLKMENTTTTTKAQVQKQETTTVLKSAKKRFTISNTKIEGFGVHTTKELLFGKYDGGSMEKTHVQARTFNVQPKRLYENPQNEATVKKVNKVQTSTSNRSISDNIPTYSKKNTFSLHNEDENEDSLKEQQVSTTGHVIKKMKENIAPNQKEIVEPVKIDLKSSRFSKLPVLPTTSTPYSRREGSVLVEKTNTFQSNIAQNKNEKLANIRKSLGGAHLNNLNFQSHTQDHVKKVVNKVNTNENKAENINPNLKKEKDAAAISARMIYEPPKYSAREVRKWEKMSGKSWYTLNCHERQAANLEMEKMVKAEKK